jgi:hypothetical protein
MIDVAPTLAALLGVPSPAHAEGRTLTHLLDAPSPAKARLIASDAARQARVAEAVAAGRLGLARVERRIQALRAAGNGLAALLALLVLRRTRPAARLGLLCGAASLAITCVVYLVVFRRISFSADRDAVPLALRTVAYGGIACAATFAVPLISVLRRRLGPADAGAFGFLAVVGASPVAVFFFILCGAYTYRFTSGPEWLAAGPLSAYARLIPVALAGTVLSAVAGIVALIPGRAPDVVTSPLAEGAPPAPTPHASQAS